MCTQLQQFLEVYGEFFGSFLEDSINFPWCLDSLQAFNIFVFALFSDMANSHDDPDSLNSLVLRWLFRDVEGLLSTVA